MPYAYICTCIQGKTISSMSNSTLLLLPFPLDTFSKSTPKEWTFRIWIIQLLGACPTHNRTCMSCTQLSFSPAIPKHSLSNVSRLWMTKHTPWLTIVEEKLVSDLVWTNPVNHLPLQYWSRWHNIQWPFRVRKIWVYESLSQLQYE